MQSNPQNQTGNQTPDENQSNHPSGFTPDSFMHQQHNEDFVDPRSPQSPAQPINSEFDQSFDPNFNPNVNQFAQADPNNPNNLNFGQNQEQLNQFSSADPNAPLVQDPYYNDYNTYNVDPYTAATQNVTQPVTPDPVDETAQANSRSTKKKSNLLFYIISGLIILALLGILGYFALQLSGNNVAGILGNSSSSSSVENVSTDSSVDQSIASSTDQNSVQSSVQASNNASVEAPLVLPVVAAKKNNATTLPTDWVKTNFADSVDADSKCTNEAKCGPGADIDSDGVSNLDEYNYGTNPNNSDADSDGVSDGDEVKIYGTDPNKKDSDGDTFEDGNELATCFDPAIRTNNKLSTKRKNDFKVNITNSKLHEPTLATMQKASANDADLAAGFIQKTCVSGTTVVQ